MQIIGLTIGGALSRLATQQKASQENWFNSLKKNKVLAKPCYGSACLFTLHSLLSNNLELGLLKTTFQSVIQDLFSSLLARLE